jgi:exodeoxyribonuclease V alpha subunit
MLYGRTVLVDEMSMCDIVVFCYLLNAVGPDGHLLLVLDPDQLPSIGPSGFMQQILRLNPYGIAICELGKVHRRKVAPGKFDLAESIRNGKFPVEEILKDATITLDPDISAEHIVNKVRELKDSGVSIGDIMVLCPGRSGVNGADTLTGQLQKLWNPDGAKIADTNYRVGDIVINVRNDYADLKKRRRAWDKLRHPDRKDNIFNGYRGIIAPGANKGTVTVQYTTPSCPVSVPYTAEELRYWVEPAYALTVHKAQGGEAKHVIFVLPGIKYRAMLYTAATRRKETICLMGSVEHFTKSAEEKETPPLTKFVQRYLEILDIDMGEEPSDIWIKI